MPARNSWYDEDYGGYGYDDPYFDIFNRSRQTGGSDEYEMMTHFPYYQVRKGPRQETARPAPIPRPTYPGDSLDPYGRAPRPGGIPYDDPYAAKPQTLELNRPPGASTDPFAGYREALRKDPFMGADENQGTLFNPRMASDDFAPKNRPLQMPSIQRPPTASERAPVARTRPVPGIDRGDIPTGIPGGYLGSVPQDDSRLPALFENDPNNVRPDNLGPGFTARPGNTPLGARGIQQGDFGLPPGDITSTPGTFGPNSEMYGRRTRDIPERPVYDMSQLKRYHDYLDTEPQRGDVKRSGWQRALDAVGAGVVGYQTGDFRQAIRYGEEAKNRPYEQAIEAWKTRGGKYQRAVELENARYKTAQDVYGRAVDDARQERQVDIQERAAQLAREKFLYEVDKDTAQLAMQGWHPTEGKNGYIVMQRVGPNGEYESKQTNEPNTKLTAAQQEARDLAQRELQWRQHTTPSGSSRLAAETSMRNTDLNVAASRQNNIESNQTRRDLAGNKGNLASNLIDPETAIKGNYPEFNQPGFVKFSRDKDGKPQVELGSRKEVEAAISRRAKNQAEANQMMMRWNEVLKLFNDNGWIEE